MSMLVSLRSAKVCCAGCSSEFGHEWDTARGRTGRVKLRRRIKHAENHQWRKEVSTELAELGY